MSVKTQPQSPLLTQHWDAMSEAERIDILKILFAPVPSLRHQAMQ